MTFLSIKCIWFKTSPKSSKKQNSSTNKQYNSNRNTQQEEDKASEENLVREAWQKQRESEQLKVNPEYYCYYIMLTLYITYIALGLLNIEHSC